MKTTLLIDSDVLAYQHAAANQQSFKFEPDLVSTTVSPLEQVTPAVDAWIEDLVQRLGADDYVVCLSVPSAECWRVKVLPSYKGNRVGVAKPELLAPIKDHLRQNHRCYERPTLEADDVMGILSTHPTLIAGRKIIVSIDKDMKTIPGWLFNPQKDRKPREVTDYEADYWHLYQTLVGDTTDGYKGCPGIGDVKAQRVIGYAPADLDKDLYTEDWWQRVVTAFESKGLTEADALVQARVARICRHTDYDFQRKEVILWSPTSSNSSPAS